MDVKRLLRKKGWTGEETGKALILDLIHSYKQILAGSKDRKPLFSQEKMVEMVSKFRTNREEAEAYNRYVNLENWIMQYQAIANSNLQRFNACCNELISIHNAAESAENEFRYIEQLPRILTQKQYDDLKAKRIEETLSTGKLDNMVGLIFRTLIYYGAELEENPKKANPLKAIRKKYMEEPVKNESILAAYKQLENGDGIFAGAIRHMNDMVGLITGDKVAIKQDEPVTKWDIISACIKGDSPLHAGEMIYSASIFPCIYALNRNNEHASAEEFLEQADALVGEFPELVEAILKMIDDQYDADKKVSETPTTEWEHTVFKWKTLYKVNFPGFRDWVESDYNVFLLDSKALTNGVAILRPSQIVKAPADIDDSGNYSEPDMKRFYANMYGLNAYLPDNEESGENIAKITQTRDILDESLRILLAYDTALELIADEIGIEDFLIFQAYSKNCIDRIKGINGLYSQLYGHIAGIDYQDRERKEAKLQAIRDVFPPFDLDSFAISSKRKAAASKMLENLDAFGEGRSGTTPGWDFLGALITPKGGDPE